MFSKNPEKLESFIGTRVDLQGELVVKGTLRIDGLVQGRVNADRVVLSETGTIKGEVKAEKIFVGGKVEGILWAREIAEIKASGKVQGDIFTNKFSVVQGGEFNGTIEMKIKEKKPLDWKVKNQHSSAVLVKTKT